MTTTSDDRRVPCPPSTASTVIHRRDFVFKGLLGLVPGILGGAAAAAAPETLPPWTRGTLDIHHIDTGVGNATFILAPDGTTILIDCGATRGGPPASTPLRPDSSRSAGDWVARYALRQSQAAQRQSLDYIIATHVHPDHVGSPVAGDPVTADGVVLTGLSQVDALMPATLVIDRGFPDYDALPLLKAPFAVNHVAWLRSRLRSGRRVERVQVGSTTQVTPINGGDFSMRFVGGNARVWSGVGDSTRDLLPPRATWTQESAPEENHMSIAMVLSFGSFRYFAGGDLVCDTHDGAFPWLDVETPIARAAGPVDVAAADHHGYFDADGPGFAQALGADAYVIQAWHATHPAMATLRRLMNGWAGRSPRDVYITRLAPESRMINSRFLPAVKSVEGHVVVRVNPDGRYRIFVTDSRDEKDTVVLASPFQTAKLART